MSLPATTSTPTAAASAPAGALAGLLPALRAMGAPLLSHTSTLAWPVCRPVVSDP